MISKRFRPDVAVLTNITEDHLDRYEYNMQMYVNSKFRIAENQHRRRCIYIQPG